MTSVVADARIPQTEAAENEAGDSWVTMPADAQSRGDGLGVLRNTLDNLSSRYSHGYEPSIEVPESLHLRDMDQVDIDAANYLGSLYEG